MVGCNGVSYIMEGGEGIIMFMEIMSHCGFCTYITPKTISPFPQIRGAATLKLGPWIIKVYSHIYENSQQQLVIGRRLKTVGISENYLKGTSA